MPRARKCNEPVTLGLWVDRETKEKLDALALKVQMTAPDTHRLILEGALEQNLTPEEFKAYKRTLTSGPKRARLRVANVARAVKRTLPVLALATLIGGDAYGANRDRTDDNLKRRRSGRPADHRQTTRENRPDGRRTSVA